MVVWKAAKMAVYLDYQQVEQLVAAMGGLKVVLKVVSMAGGKAVMLDEVQVVMWAYNLGGCSGGLMELY